MVWVMGSDVFEERRLPERGKDDERDTIWEGGCVEWKSRERECVCLLKMVGVSNRKPDDDDDVILPSEVLFLISSITLRSEE
ncbi:hypothetical protein BOTNAR_0348g00050 [Botryotinia narcissicola]|uniref:Uncharacterized protein n=1 Tax=Botryotinia narcissicola TaxID=278944 RepID=A0A4Z1HWZ7_9HELO|nr:hypothetical protein BOTNAR_0348g00050 [Botryotinia narcissicola]